MDAYLIEWGSLLLRWLHLIVGIAWIGSSFYFVWLDNSLKPPTDPALKAKGVGGELWAVHGGGFYNPQKYLVAPAHLPDELHWFKWESYSTWLSGFALISTVYYLQAGSYMVDPSVAAIRPGTAVAIGLGTLAGGAGGVPMGNFTPVEVALPDAACRRAAALALQVRPTTNQPTG